MASIEELRLEFKVMLGDSISKLQQLDRQTKKTAQESKSMGESMAGLKSSMAGPIAAAALVGTAVFAAGKEMVKLAAGVKRTKMEFSVLTGSMETSNQLFSQMNALAAQTPLELESITSAGKQLLSVGIPVDQITEKLRMLGDVAMGNPEKLDRLTQAFGQLKSKGTASMEQLNRFTEAGVPIMAELQKQTGKTGDEVFKMVSAGKIGYPEVTKALEGLTGEGGLMHDMMAKVATTTEGKFSTAMDNAKMRLKEWGATLLPAVNKGLDEFNAWMDKIADKKNFNLVMEMGMGSSITDVKKALEFVNKGIEKFSKETGRSIEEVVNSELGDEKRALTLILNMLEAKASSQTQMSAKEKASAEASAKAAEKNAEAVEYLSIIEPRYYSAATEGALEHKVAMEEEAQAAAKVAAMYGNMYDGAIEHAFGIAKANQEQETSNELMREYMRMTGAGGGKKTDSVAETIKGIAEGWNLASGALGAYGDLVKNQGDAEIAAMRKRGATDEEIKKKQNEINQKAFEANKANKLAEIAINTAVETSKVLATPWMAALIVGLGAAQAGMVAAQSYVPMAEGGSGIVTKPTLFLAGEAGPEPFAFGGANNKLGMGGAPIINVNVGISRKAIADIAVVEVSQAGRSY